MLMYVMLRDSYSMFVLFEFSSQDKLLFAYLLGITIFSLAGMTI